MLDLAPPPAIYSEYHSPDVPSIPENGETPPVIVPMYWYPYPTPPQGVPGMSDSIGVCSSYPPGKLNIVFNPDSGPGSSSDENYATLIKECVEVYGQLGSGYVDTNYGNRPIDDVKADILAWFDIYGSQDALIHGLFLDQVSNDPSTVDYYKAIRQFITDLQTSLGFNVFVVANPGAESETSWQAENDVSDVIIIAENHIDVVMAVLNNLTGWESDYSSDKFGVIAYGLTTQEQVDELVELAHSKGITGLIYVTGDTLDDSGIPYDSPPEGFFWNRLQETLRLQFGLFFPQIKK